MSWHRILATGLAVLGALSAQTDPTQTISEMASGIFRGTLESLEGNTSAGQLNARNADGEVYFCAYDSRTYVEVNQWRVAPNKLQPGDRVEVLADRRPGQKTCYVRTVHVGLPPPKLRTAREESAKPPPEPMMQPRGDRTIAGVVIRLAGSKLTLRTRTGEQTFLLRVDTRYLADGAKQDAGALHVNTRVSVRAGDDLRGGVEAYQVMWGEILTVPTQ